MNFQRGHQVDVVDQALPWDAELPNATRDFILFFRITRQNLIKHID
jgi:hypothetical protein